jgi:hypothetical protein
MCGAAGTGGAGTPSCQCSSGSNISVLPLEHQISTARGTTPAHAPAAMAAGRAPTAAPLPPGRVLPAPALTPSACSSASSSYRHATGGPKNAFVGWISHGINAINFPHCAVLECIMICYGVVTIQQARCVGTFHFAVCEPCI